MSSRTVALDGVAALEPSQVTAQVSAQLVVHVPHEHGGASPQGAQRQLLRERRPAW